VLEFVKCLVIAIKVMVLHGGRSPSPPCFLVSNFCIHVTYLDFFFLNSLAVYFFHIANGINIFHGTWNGVV
jgi:hypothetical protein